MEKGETPEAAATVAHETVKAFSSPAEALRFAVFTKSGEVERSYSFRVTESAGACTLELYRREKRTKKGGGYRLSSFASRKLPGCACVD